MGTTWNEREYAERADSAVRMCLLGVLIGLLWLVAGIISALSGWGPDLPRVMVMVRG